MKIVQMTRSEFKTRMERVIEGIANDLRNKLVRSCPVDTGRLKISIRVEKTDKDIIEIRMVDYALHVEFGTAPHIRLVNKKALHWKSGGKDVFATIVRHPGTQPQPFIRHPGTQPQPFIRNTVRTKLKRIIMDNINRHLIL